MNQFGTQASSFPSIEINTSPSPKRKRRPAGTPDPDAEVISLSPQTLLESDNYVCEICNQGFQRDQNLQMHRRRHNVPWKLVKREGSSEMKKRAFVCPEPSCLHHDPRHALGDLVGIKKHYRRKHSDQRQWVCGRCSKGYAVQSDYKAHLKTCGTKGHSCDCGRVFSRVESFIEHQDTCNGSRSRTSVTTSPSPSNELIPGPTTWPDTRMPGPDRTPLNLELLLLPESTVNHSIQIAPRSVEPDHKTSLKLSIGYDNDNTNHSNSISMQEATKPRLELTLSDRARADEARQCAKRQIELAEQELRNAKRTRHQAQVELSKAHAIRDNAIHHINATLLRITCCACKQKSEQRRLGSTQM